MNRHCWRPTRKKELIQLLITGIRISASMELQNTADTDLELRSVPFHTVHCIVADLSSISDFWLGLPTGILFVNVLSTPGMTSSTFHGLQLIDFPGGLDVPHLDYYFTPWKPLQRFDFFANTSILFFVYTS